MSDKVSICIAAYEMGGKGKEFLEQSFHAINQQTHKNIEVVISDQSTDDNIKNLCEEWTSFLNIKYVWFDGERKSSSNTNNAIKNATGDIIKILFMDDLIFTKHAIENVVEGFKNEPNKMWLVCSSGILNDASNTIQSWMMVPKYHDEIHKGVNTISSPSVLSIRNTPELIYFDEELIWLMDVEYYKRLHDKFGAPVIVESNSPDILNRIHDDSVTSSLTSSDDIKNKELEYVIEKIERIST